MRDRIRRGLSGIAPQLNLDRMISWSGQHSVFPFYHSLAPASLPHICHLYRVLKPEEFEADLDQLLKHFEPLSLAEYLDGKGAGKVKKSMVLSFDDGLKECHDIVAPLLKKKGVPAVFFLNNKFIDNKGLFYRYRASLLIHRVREDCRAREKVAAFLQIAEDQVETSIGMIGWNQRALLDALAVEAELDFTGYLRSRPVYMSTGEVEDLLEWGFEIGAHSDDHADFTRLDPDEMTARVSSSIMDLEKRFGIHTSYFSFPFSSDGIPAKVIDTLLKEGTAGALLGTAGLKRTFSKAYIQRIPMEKYQLSALDIMKTEYLYFLLKAPLGRNRLRR